MKTLFILNDPPYGTERSYNGLRLANALAKREEEEVRVFLMGDGVACALSGQKTPNGYYNLERMLKGCARRGIEVACCGSCLDARGIGDDRLVEVARRSSLEEL
ncbi:MAG: DsrE family protein, partial [Gaiellales bacterium]